MMVKENEENLQAWHRPLHSADPLELRKLVGDLGGDLLADGVFQLQDAPVHAPKRVREEALLALGPAAGVADEDLVQLLELRFRATEDDDVAARGHALGGRSQEGEDGVGVRVGGVGGRHGGVAGGR